VCRDDRVPGGLAHGPPYGVLARQPSLAAPPGALPVLRHLQNRNLAHLRLVHDRPRRPRFSQCNPPCGAEAGVYVKSEIPFHSRQAHPMRTPPDSLTRRMALASIVGGGFAAVFAFFVLWISNWC